MAGPDHGIVRLVGAPVLRHGFRSSLASSIITEGPLQQDSRRDPGPKPRRSGGLRAGKARRPDGMTVKSVAQRVQPFRMGRHRLIRLLREGADASEIALSLLSSPSVASKRWAYDQYDSAQEAKKGRDKK